MEHTEVRTKYLVHFNGSFWITYSLEAAKKDEECLKKCKARDVAISEFIEYIKDGQVINHEERKLQ